MKYGTRIFFLIMLSGYFSCDKWDLEQEDFIQVKLIQATATGLTSGTADAEALDLNFLLNGKAYLNDNSSFWNHDPSEETWTQRTSIPASGASFAAGGAGYNISNQVWAYYPLKECQ